MNIGEIYESELWQKLMRNNAFNSKFFEVIRRANYYVKEEDLKLNIEGNYLIISYSTPIQELDDSNDCISSMRYEFSIDKDGNLLFDEKFGTLDIESEPSFLDNVGGMINTEYSFSIYDQDSIEISNQKYTDSYVLKTYEVETAKKNFEKNLRKTMKK